MKQALVLLNRAARGAPEALATDALEALRGSGFEVTVADAMPSSVDGLTLVVSIGGDGTAREVAERLATALGTWPAGAGGPAAADAPCLLVLPAGTGNSVHKSLWDDRSAADTLAAALGPSSLRRDLDLARIEGHDRAVLLGASAGFLRWTVEATARFPDLFGRDLYAAAGLAAAQELRPYPGRVSVDGRLVAEGPIALAAVGGAPRRGGSLHLFPHSRLDDGLLDVCVVTAAGPDDAVPLLLAAMEGAHLGQPGVHYAQGHEVTLESLDGPLPFEHDGDLWPGTESTLRLSVVPAALPVLAPPILPD